MMTTEDFVYLLWHTRMLPSGDEDEKLLGVYSTEEHARQRIVDAGRLPGFRLYPDGFEVVRYCVDKDEWLEGFAEIDGVDVPDWLHGRDP
jgi:hypothetical protein